MAEGFVKLYRQITENEFYFSERFTKAQAWVDLLLLATYKVRTVFIRGIEIELQPGQLCYSQLTLADRWKWNFKTVVSFLKLLEKRGMLETKTNNITTIISIKNWKLYQGNGEQNGDQIGEQKESKTETNKKVKNIKESKEEIYIQSIHEIQVFIQKNCSRVSKLPKQLTPSECDKLLTNYEISRIQEILLSMENYKPLLKNYESVYLTVLNWLKRNGKSNNGKNSESNSLKISSKQTFDSLIN
jgi:DNA-binding transcriptional MocR family regulator